jgi:transposase
MAAPLSQDLRKPSVDEVEQGSSARQAAARFAVSASAAIKLVRRVRETGSTEPGKIGGHRKPLPAAHKDLLHELTATRKGIHLGRDQGCADRTRDPAWFVDDDLVDAAPPWTDTQKSAARGRARAAGRS